MKTKPLYKTRHLIPLLEPSKEDTKIQATHIHLSFPKLGYIRHSKIGLKINTLNSVVRTTTEQNYSNEMAFEIYQERHVPESSGEPRVLVVCVSIFGLN